MSLFGQFKRQPVKRHVCFYLLDLQLLNELISPLNILEFLLLKSYASDYVEFILL